jgi:SAM-dependent methyltransferase
LSRLFTARLTDEPYRDVRPPVRRSYWQCRACGHVSVDLYEPERYSRYYESLPPTYHKSHDVDLSRYQKITRLVQDFRPQRLIDFGCGSGTFLKMLPAEIEKFGVEPSAHAARQLRESGITVLRDQQFGSPNLCGTFDVVTAIDVVEHTKALGSLRQHFATLLRPGGRLILLTGDLSSSAASWVGRYWHYMHHAEHVTFFSADSMKAWLQPEFDSIEVVRTRHHPLSVGDLLVMSRRWLLFPLKVVLDAIGFRGNFQLVLPVCNDHMLVQAVRQDMRNSRSIVPQQTRTDGLPMSSSVLS